jgi:hypothetical protein
LEIPRGLPAAAARFVARHARAVTERHAEFDHGRRRALVGRLAPDGDGFRHLPVGGVGAAKLIHRAPRRAGPGSAKFDRGRDIGWLDLGNAFDVGRLVRIGGIGGKPVAQHEIGRLRADQGRRRRDGERRHGDANCCCERKRGWFHHAVV